MKAKRKLLFFILIISTNLLFAQNKFEKSWIKIDSLVSKGLTKSAVKSLKDLYLVAKNNNNQEQVIKSLLYETGLNINLTENALIENIKLIDKEVSEAKEPEKQILYSIEAGKYLDYFNRNRYKIYNRSNIKGFNKEDLATWTIADLHNKIAKLFLKSIENEQLLKSIAIKKIDVIFIKGNTDQLRPTLFDFLAHRALEYFKNNEPDIIKASYSFEIKDSFAFAPANEFINHVFKNNDSLSLHFRALQLFQKLLRFHIHDIDASSLIDVDLERVQFIHDYAMMEKKDELYLASLKEIYLKHKFSMLSSDALFLIAQQMFSKHSQKNVDDTGSTKELSSVKNVLDSIVKNYPGTDAAAHAENLLHQILRKTLTLTSEKVNISTEPFRTLITYKNISSIYLRILEVNESSTSENILQGNQENKWKMMVKVKPLKSWKQILPLPNDYQSHSTEIKVDGLAVGKYILIASEQEDFNLINNALSGEYLYVSNISFIQHKNEFFLLNRKTGFPLPNADFTVSKINYDYNRDKAIDSLLGKFSSDVHGYLKLNINDDENYDIKVDVKYKNDHLSMNDDIAINNYNSDEALDKNDSNDVKEYESNNSKFFLFTDRSIYRPGQNVYFKAIGITKEIFRNASKLLTFKKPITVYLNDANGQSSDSLIVYLNDFGSINGKFKLPANKLNGIFTITIKDFDNSNVEFSVEEYKRPNFLIVIDNPSGNFELNQNIKVTGSARAYAGNSIDNASVKYHVMRVTRFVYNWMWQYQKRPSSLEQEISSGTTTTKNDGTYTFNFIALADNGISKKLNPIFDYKIDVDVTDINGETRTASSIIHLGYSSRIINTRLVNNQNISADSLKELFVSTTNLNNELIHSKVTLKVFKLKSPDRLIRERFWQRPDQFVLDKKEFLQYFPFDEYDHELEMSEWDKQLVIQVTDTANQYIKLPNYEFESGWYYAESSSKENDSIEINDIKYFQVYNLKKPNVPNEYFQNLIVKNIVEPGEKATFVTATGAENIFLIENISNSSNGKKDTNSIYHYLTLNKETRKFEFPVKEEDRGAFAINHFFVKENRFYNTDWKVIIPWTNKLLDVKFTTFRDKTIPGSKEKWKINITGKNGQKASAELLATMYDASLDQIKTHEWNIPEIWETSFINNDWESANNFAITYSIRKIPIEKSIPVKVKQYDQLINPQRFSTIVPRIRRDLEGTTSGVSIENSRDVVVAGYAAKRESGLLKEMAPAHNNDESHRIITTNGNPINLQIRKNLNETAFFYPDLKTDDKGNIEFSFTMPEAVTQWKMMAFAHTKDLSTGYSEKSLITQKDLMVQPNMPRFLRAGDTMILNTKVVNLTDKLVDCNVTLQLFNSLTLEPINEILHNESIIKKVKLDHEGSQLLEFPIVLPSNFSDPVTYRFIATAGNMSDGEEATIPVLPNKILVTETLPLQMNGTGSKDYDFKKLGEFGRSSTLENKSLTIEYSTNPAWYAVQALPYLMQYPYECAEQTFNRYYANALAYNIVNGSSKIRSMFEKWKVTDTSSLLLNLQTNSELKSIMLEETPWIQDAQNESLQRKNIALLFDITTITDQKINLIQKLAELQTNSGGFSWFKGGRDDIYISQYILSGLGHLKKLQAFTINNTVNEIIRKALLFVDLKNKERYDNLLINKRVHDNNQLSYEGIQYLYMRSFYPEYPLLNTSKAAYEHYINQSKKEWLNKSIYMQGMISLYLNRKGDISIAKGILKSLKENAIINKDLGMYWKEISHGGYRWYEAPIETESLMIEAFSEILSDENTLTNLKTWLLKSKQVNNWKTTKATADACYALLLQGSDVLSENKNVVIKLGKTVINSKDQNSTAGTGYFKTKISPELISTDMAVINTTISSDETSKQMPSWGAVYWQYLENMDKVTFSETPLKIQKKLFIESINDRGVILIPITENTTLKIGDKIKVRIELRVDRDMEYIHMKDMRSSNLEPINVISGYKYQDGLGYYESTKDASTDFFFDQLIKGTYVFEYPLTITHKGNFNNGITSIECMYAPEYSAHTEGSRIQVK